MKEIIFNLVNGIRSGIPVCCTLFFTYHAISGRPVGQHVHEKRTGKPFDLYNHVEGSAEYVQCNACDRKNRVEQIHYNGVIMKWLIGR